MRNYLLYNQNREIVDLYLGLINKAVRNDITKRPFKCNLYFCSREVRVLNTLRFYYAVLKRDLYKFPNSFWFGSYSVERQLVCYLFLREYLLEDVSSTYIDIKDFKKFRLYGMLSIRFMDTPYHVESYLSTYGLSDLYVSSCDCEGYYDPYRSIADVYEYANEITLNLSKSDLNKSSIFN